MILGVFVLIIFTFIRAVSYFLGKKWFTSGHIGPYVNSFLAKSVVKTEARVVFLQCKKATREHHWKLASHHNKDLHNVCP